MKHTNNPQKIGIIGLGWLGEPLAKHLQQQNIEITGTCTSIEKANLLCATGISVIKYRFPEDLIPDAWFYQLDTLIIAIPPSKVGNDYLFSLKKLSESISKSRVSKVIFISSIGVFDDENQTFNEKSIPSLQSAKSKLLFEAEQIFSNIQASIIRLGGLYGENRHPGKWFAGKKNIPNGLAPINLISLNECICLFDKILKTAHIPQIIHGVSDFHPTKLDFYTKKTQELGLELPEFMQEKNAWKIVESIYPFI